MFVAVLLLTDNNNDVTAKRRRQPALTLVMLRTLKPQLPYTHLLSRLSDHTDLSFTQSSPHMYRSTPIVAFNMADTAGLGLIATTISKPSWMDMNIMMAQSQMHA